MYNMTELFLHYVWKNRLYRFQALRTTQNEKLVVIHPGFQHQDAGPDFKQAIIKLNDITWAGDVEIHCKSSDWHKHGHDHNPQYKSVILHVVFENDCPINNHNRELLPTLELKDLISSETLLRYNRLHNSPHRLPCKHEITKLPTDFLEIFSQKLINRRLIRKGKNIFSLLEKSEHDWQEVFFKILVVNFGFKINQDAFELLSKTLSYKIILKHSKSKLQLYALLFGQAGKLEDYQLTVGDSYYQKLHQEYHYLKHQYRLISIPVHRWNLLRIHPQNFPALRLAQLAEFLYRFPMVFHHFITEDLKIFEFLKWRCEPDEYWKTHFLFGNKTKKHSAILGKSSKELLIINSIIPTLFTYGAFSGNMKLQENAIKLLEIVSFEKNYITKYYRQVGFPAQNALHSQAILELQSCYCQTKQCLQCDIGKFIIGRNNC